MREKQSEAVFYILYSCTVLLLPLSLLDIASHERSLSVLRQFKNRKAVGYRLNNGLSWVFWFCSVCVFFFLSNGHIGT